MASFAGRGLSSEAGSSGRTSDAQCRNWRYVASIVSVATTRTIFGSCSGTPLDFVSPS